MVFSEDVMVSPSNKQCIDLRVFIKGHIPLLMLRLSMLDGVLMLWMNLPVVNTIHPQIMCARFVGGVKIAATGDSKHCDSLTKQPRIEISCFSVQDIEYMYH